MPKKHLTDSFIKTLEAPKKRTEYYDQHLIDTKSNTFKSKGVKGLLLRVTEAGNKYFYYSYWYNGKSKRFKIGDYPNISLSDARQNARELAGKVNMGIDPQAEKNKRKHQSKPQTFKELAAEFKEKHLPTLRESTRIEYERIIDVELIPKLGKHSIEDISRNQIMSLLDAKAYGKDPAPVMANRIRARLSKIYSFAISRGLIEVNPVSRVPKYKKTNKGEEVEQRRDRYYKPDEIRELWEYFENWDEPTGSVFKMLLICGQRKTETMKMKWDDIQGDVWTIPASIAKNKDEHLVPLPEMALEVLEKMRSISGHSDYVFCSPKKQNEPIQWIKRAVSDIQNLSEVNDFRPHDLRRTFATYMTKLGVDRTVLGKVLNHKGLSGDGQVTAIYDRHSYMKEKRQAMKRWSHKLEQILEGKEKSKILKLG